MGYIKSKCIIKGKRNSLQNLYPSLRNNKNVINYLISEKKSERIGNIYWSIEAINVDFHFALMIILYILFISKELEVKKSFCW